MRLHKISLLNLNSLYGEQSLDLDRDLQGASLFLIHGRTGSGKSTVMDAVSLALFGKTPRLDAQRNALGADPCAIMSRGTAECRAVVEFSRLFADRSRVRYRAAWSVRRAHKRADGSLQPIEQSLERLDSRGQWELLASGRKQTEFKKALSDVLEGFTVDDFHRSMLLAQGRFDELLNAKPEHRAAILERLTNTDEYASIGSSAAEVAKAHRRNIEISSARLGGTTPVTDEEVAKASGAAKTAHERVELCARALNAAKVNLQWWTDGQRLHGELVQLDSEKSTLETLAEQLAPLLARIAEHQRCTGGFAALDRLGHLDGQLAKSSAEIERNGAILTETRLVREQRLIQRDSDEQAAKNAEDLLQHLQVPCAAYAAAREAADSAKKLLDGLRVQAATAQSDFGKKTEAVVQATAEVEKCTFEARRAKQALAACDKTRLVRERWRAQWQELCIDLEGQEKNLALAIREQGSREQGLLVAESAVRVRKQEYLERRAMLLEKPEAAAAESRERLTKLVGADEPRTRIRCLRDAVEQGCREVAALQNARRELLVAEALDAELERATAQLAEAERVAAAQATDAVGAREAARHAALRSIDAERHLHRLELVVEVSKRREALSRGDECPLCGSREHPYLDDPARCPDESIAIRALADAREERALREKQAAEAERVARESEKAADKSVHARDAKRAVCADIVVRIQGCADPLANARKAALLSEHCRSDECTRRLSLQTAQLEALQRELLAIEEATEAADSLQQELAKLQVALTNEGEALKTESIALEQQRKTLCEQRTRLDERRQQFEDSRSTFRAALQGAEAEVVVDCETNRPGETELVGWRGRVEAQIAVLDKAERTSDLAESKLREALKDKETRTIALAEAEERLASTRAQANEQTTEYLKSDDRRQALLTEIRALWSTRRGNGPTEPSLPEAADAAAILEHVRQHTQRMKQAASKSRELAEAAIRKEEQQLGLLKALAAARVELEEEHDGARHGFSMILAELGLETEDQLLARRMQPDELRGAQGALADLERQQQTWKTRQEERLLALRKHELAVPAGFPITDAVEREALRNARPRVVAGSEQAHMPGESLASILSAVVEQAAVQLDVATQGEQACLFELADTKRRQAEYASAGKALREAERRASVWLSLDALIGTRNGDAFRQFAQGLNLHRLIQKANVHLQRLSERYTLTQARNDDMPTLDFAIKDHWQGGEPRSTRTLSGGERFLVSLALALGLSDLRTQLLPIETLVLDEGFGTLDPDTLEVALAALQRLHADGRQVGVISHVNGLKERIEAQVQIVEEGAGRSRIVVVAPKLG